MLSSLSFVLILVFLLRVHCRPTEEENQLFNTSDNSLLEKSNHTQAVHNGSTSGLAGINMFILELGGAIFSGSFGRIVKNTVYDVFDIGYKNESEEMDTYTTQSSMEKLNNDLEDKSDKGKRDLNDTDEEDDRSTEKNFSSVEKKHGLGWGGRDKRMVRRKRFCGYGIGCIDEIVLKATEMRVGADLNVTDDSLGAQYSGSADNATDLQHTHPPPTDLPA